MTVAVNLGLVDDMLEHIPLTASRNHSEIEWKQVGRHGVVAVAAFLCIEILCVERLTGRGGIFIEYFHVLRMSGNRSELHHLVQKEIVERCRKERCGRLSRWILGMNEFQRLRRHTPVTVGVLDHNAILQVL